jgi:hypothetical protein
MKVFYRELLVDAQTQTTNYWNSEFGTIQSLNKRDHRQQQRSASTALHLPHYRGSKSAGSTKVRDASGRPVMTLQPIFNQDRNVPIQEKKLISM